MRATMLPTEIAGLLSAGVIYDNRADMEVSHQINYIYGQRRPSVG